MWDGFVLACLCIYLLCSFWFLFGSGLQIHLMWKAGRAPRNPPVRSENKLPFVTVQVPVFNERFVIGRLLTSLGQLTYPRHLLEIQVLDDSTDDTTAIIANAAAKLRSNGLSVDILRRTNRTGFKAGALQAGLEKCNGELIAIFDADFVPPADFLLKMVGYFSDEHVGGVQGRWVHQNLHQNPLTRIQAFLLDSHFNLEQSGRAASGYFVNFNGTAGVWRKACIHDAGGWNGDILTEDLELSYRAQLKGWIFHYDNEITVPSDLPDDINAFKSQQFRWAKGMAQTAVQHLVHVWNANMARLKKMHALFHLLASMSFLAVFGTVLMTVPILIGRQYDSYYQNASNIVLLTGITLPALCLYYYFGTRASFPPAVFWKYLPLFLIVYMALSVQNSVAVLQGLVGYRTPFERTPKKTGTSGASAYFRTKWKSSNTCELLALLYVMAGIGVSIYYGDYFFVMLLLMVAAGLSVLLTPALTNALRSLLSVPIAAKPAATKTWAEH